MQTKSGKKIKNLTVVGKVYVGIVDGKILTWDESGRRTSKNRSKLDMNLVEKNQTTLYININNWNGDFYVDRNKFDTMDEALSNKKSGYVKTVEIKL